MLLIFENKKQIFFGSWWRLITSLVVSFMFLYWFVCLCEGNILFSLSFRCNNIKKQKNSQSQLGECSSVGKLLETTSNHQTFAMY
jgi:hypothetical protein